MQNGKILGTNKIWEILEMIPDPEIPIISIVDLGVVRGVEYMENQLIITVTPTYSGCPAMDFIKEEIVPGECFIFPIWKNVKKLS